MELEALPQAFSICEVADITSVDLNRDFCFLAKTDGEISVVCETEAAPQTVTHRDDGWRAFRVRGVLEFSLVGVLSAISGILAASDIGIFAVSTYNTDYIFTKAENFQNALAALATAGYIIRK